jgi:hypothetical protein
MPWQGALQKWRAVLLFSRFPYFLVDSQLSKEKMLFLHLPDSIIFKIAALLLHDTEKDIVFGLQEFERSLNPTQRDIVFFESFVDSLTQRDITRKTPQENARVMLALATLTADTQAQLLDPFIIFARSCSKFMEISTSILGLPKQRHIHLMLSAIQMSRRDRHHHLHAAAWSLRHSSFTAFSTTDGALVQSKRALPAQLALKRKQQKDSVRQYAIDKSFTSSIDPTRQSFKTMAASGKDAAVDSFFADVPTVFNSACSLHEVLETGAFGSTFALPDGVYDCRELVVSRNNRLLPCSPHRVVFEAGLTFDSVSATVQSCVFSGRKGDTLPLVLVESGSILFENCVFLEAAVAVKISNRNRLPRIGHSQPIVQFVNCFFHSCYTCLESGSDRGYTGIITVRHCKFANCVNCITGMGVSWVSGSTFENCSSAVHPSAESKIILLGCTFIKCSTGILMDCDALMRVKECLFIQCYSAGAHLQFDGASTINCHFCECFIGLLISNSSKSRIVECKFNCCGLAGVQIIEESAPTLIACQSNNCFAGISTLGHSKPRIDSCSGRNDLNSINVCDHSSPQIFRFKAFDSKIGASAFSDSPMCHFSECVFEKCSTSAFSAHSSFVGVCVNCEAHDCITAFAAVVNCRGDFKGCKAVSCNVGFQLEGHARAERCVASECCSGFTGGGLSESTLSHCQALHCEVGIIVCGNMSVQFCQIRSCQEGILCSGLQQSVIKGTQIFDCATGLALVKLGLVYQCHIARSSLYGVRFDPSCEISLKSSCISKCNIGVFDRSGGGLAHSCAVQLCDIGVLLEGEILTRFERCVMDQNQKGCIMEGVLGSGTVKLCTFKRSRIFGLGLFGQGDPGFVISENSVLENTTGVVYDCTSSPLLCHNTVSKNLLSGVLFKPGCSVMFRHNRMIGNKGHGMQVMTNGACMIEDNVAEKNEKFGVFFMTSQGSSDLVFRKNSFCGNVAGGINVAPGSQGRITEW